MTPFPISRDTFSKETHKNKGKKDFFRFARIDTSAYLADTNQKRDAVRLNRERLGI